MLPRDDPHLALLLAGLTCMYGKLGESCKQSGNRQYPCLCVLQGEAWGAEELAWRLTQCHLRRRCEQAPSTEVWCIYDRPPPMRRRSRSCPSRVCPSMSSVTPAHAHPRIKHAAPPLHAACSHANSIAQPRGDYSETPTYKPCPEAHATPGTHIITWDRQALRGAHGRRPGTAR